MDGSGRFFKSFTVIGITRKDNLLGAYVLLNAVFHATPVLSLSASHNPERERGGRKGLQNDGG